MDSDIICDFGSAFAYQDHPNVEVVACAELLPEKLKLLQERVKAKKAYPNRCRLITFM